MGTEVQGLAFVDSDSGERGGIAFVEYCFQVRANCIGHYEFTAAQLKTIQEVLTLVVFSSFRCCISRSRSSGTIWPGLA